MKRAFLFILLIGTCATAGEHVRTTRSLDWLVKHPVIVRMHESQNEQRARYGLAPLKLDDQLSLSSQRHADQLIREGSFYHGSGVAEILHWGVRSPEAATAGWMASPPHSALMLNPSFTACGCGYSADASGNTRWVIRFR